ncbi:hypothetical protein WT38_07220 [Burkholderia territorii]|nr:hypothetical protein WT38_07220 [Burkholderia territorii]
MTEFDDGLLQLGNKIDVVRQDHRVRSAVFRLLEVRKHADFLKAAIDEIQIVFPLHAIRIRRQRLVEIEAECTACLRMLVEDVAQDLLAILFLPVAHIATQAQKIEPRRKCQLVIGQRAIESQPAESMNVPVDRHVRAVRLLNPEGDGLGEQGVELDLTAARRNSVDDEFVIATEFSRSFHIKRQ